MFRKFENKNKSGETVSGVNLARWGIAIEKRGLLIEVKNLAWHSKIDKTKIKIPLI